MRAGTVGWALFAIAALAARAAAQTPAANITPPAEKYAVAPGGVDMRSRRYVYSQTDLSIGGESGALALTRTLAQPVVGHNNPFANFSHNWEVLASEKRINVQQSLFTCLYGPDRHPNTAPARQGGGRRQPVPVYRTDGSRSPGV